ncbi:MAG: CHAT domain-containing protein [Phormidesmis sp. RL_2_1]|nr:CHAT domain-containing protein [Phormidesmis sp. RL_2_1]
MDSLTAPVIPRTIALSESGSLTDLLNQGQQQYNAGRFADAVELWQQAVEQAIAINNDQQQAIAQHYLAMGQQALGNWSEATAAITQAKTLLSNNIDSFLYAQVLNSEGNLQLQTGQSEAALATWQAAEALYRRQSATSDLVRNQLNQAHALRVLGHYRRAKQILESLNEELSTQSDTWLKAQALQSLGITLRAAGDLERSESILSTALDIAVGLPSEALPSPTAPETLRLSLAKTLAVFDQAKQAIALAQQVKEKSDQLQTQIEATLLQFQLWQKQQNEAPDNDAQDNEAQDNEAQWQTLFSDLQVKLQSLPASRWGIYAQVNFAAIALQHTAQSTPYNPIRTTTASLLANAIKQAQSLSDIQAQSYALGELGKAYEQVSQWDDALESTQRALNLAEQIQAIDIVAKWQRQKGRILSHPDNPNQNLAAAIATYTEAVSGLESIQQDLVAMNPEVQFSFREQVESVYRELVELLLANVDALPQQIRQQRLEQSREVIESLQLAELQNYFREACLTYQARSIETIDPHAAVIYPILLRDRIEVIVSLPNQPLQHHGTAASRAQQTALFEDFYFRLNPIFPAARSLPPAQQLYDWLIRPFKDLLEQQSIDTLVFVSDGFLRSLPMAALHDGQQYLLEQYRIALTPGMQLLPSQPLRPQALNILTVGMSEARLGFSAIPAVAREMESIGKLANSEGLFNADFTKDNFFKAVDTTPANVVHIATHGQFSSVAKDTFLLAWDGRINVSELDELFRQHSRDRPIIELLVLSACQTASGDEKAALGMAGTAIRSGARSTIATLWSVADESTAELMTTFYTLLSQQSENKHHNHQPDSTSNKQIISAANIGRAETLRQAQLSLLNSAEFSHPFYWSPFVLVGNWQ